VIVDSEQLYQDRILALARLARQHQHEQLDAWPLTATIKNPACGDLVEVGLKLDDDNLISAITAHAKGCALCEASTGLLLTTLMGKHKDDVPHLHASLSAWLKGADNDLKLDDLDAFTPVRNYTSRHVCVCLPFQAAAQAINDFKPCP
jgi:nitrogen fixation NifU-like protein